MVTKKITKEFPKGLSKKVVKEISRIKKEPMWMLNFRLESYDIFKNFSEPLWGPNLKDLDLQDIRYYTYGVKKVKSWEEIPKEIKDTFEKLGISKQEQKLLAGLSTQY